MASLASLLVILSVSCVAVEGISKRTDTATNDACSSENANSFLGNDRLLNLHQKSAILTDKPPSGATYSYYIGICTPPDPTYEDNTCMVIQTEINDTTKEIRKPWCLGRKKGAQLTDTLNKGWIELTYTGGDEYNTHCDQGTRTTRIFFFCDSSAGEGVPEFIEENNDNNLCYYLFTWPTSYICPDTPIDPGWIVIIILVILVFLWGVAMLIGIIVQRVVMGAKGWNQIPFLRWYQLFGDLEVDGCNLVCRCNRGREKMVPMTTIGKQPLADPEEPESESESETEHKDEDLIPM